MTCKVAIYMRVATADQLFDNHGIAVQRAAILDHLNRSGVADGYTVEEFRDIGFKGTDLNRPALRELLSRTQKGEFDILCVQSLSRLSRGSMIVEELYQTLLLPHGVRLLSAQERLDSKSPMWFEFLEMHTRLIDECRNRARKGGLPDESSHVSSYLQRGPRYAGRRQVRVQQHSKSEDVVI